jgi:hypothetical protein
VPLSVVTELREKNRILAGQMAEAQRQNAALMERLNAGTAQHPPQAGGVGGDDAIAPEDERVVNEITRRILGQLAPGFQQMQRVSAWAEGQEREQRLQRAQAVRAQIMERHEVFRHPVFGEFANLALQSKLAQYEAQRIPVNPFEVAEEVALDVQARLQAHNATVAQSLVAGSQAAAPGAGSGAAVTTGQATAPLSNPLPPPKNSFEAAQRYKAEQLRQGRAAVGQA